MSGIDREIETLQTMFRSVLALVLGACASTQDAPTADAGDAAPSCVPETFVPNPPDTCGNYVRFTCGLPAPVRDNCYLAVNDCAALCPGIQFNCRVIEGYCLDGGTVTPDDAGAVVVDCATCPTGVGRVSTAAPPSDDWFARAARHEAASCDAFRALAHELSEHEAPQELVARARRAARDEARHARMMKAHARQPIPRASRKPRASRSLEAIAIENAVEGCVNETFGALVLLVRSERSTLRSTFTSIAVDEIEHAALSWAIASWAATKLDDAARDRVDRAFRAAREALLADTTGLAHRLAIALF